VKTKNYHWPLRLAFFRLPLALYEHAGQILASVDILAKRVRKIGGTTIRSVGHISRLQTLEDDDDALLPAGEMVRRLVKTTGTSRNCSEPRTRSATRTVMYQRSARRRTSLTRPSAGRGSCSRSTRGSATPSSRPCRSGQLQVSLRKDAHTRSTFASVWRRSAGREQLNERSGICTNR
jgi:hypothetical protein